LSRKHIRQDKTCLNCGAIAQERYCTRCGQENVEPRETVGHLIGHFFADITHFDSKFFTTLKDLVFRPGFLTREYISGKRTRYLNPIRMYVFISALFFLAMYAEMKEKTPRLSSTGAANLYRQHFADSLRGSVREGRMEGQDSSRNGGGNRSTADSVRGVVIDEIASRLDTAEGLAPNEESFYMGFDGATVAVDLAENKYKTLREYDSVQRALPDTAKDAGIMRWFLRNNVRLKEKTGGRSRVHIEGDVRHTIPKLMFVLLPLFALYIGWFHSRKKYYYVQHAIFSIHFHSFVFLLLLVSILLTKLFAGGLPGGFGVAGLAMILVCTYLVVALRNAYQQAIGWALLKAIAVSLIYLLTIILALGVLEAMIFLRA
jgi:hypothetical protein